jgi:ABC-type multidrug transport system permease subunit
MDRFSSFYIIMGALRGLVAGAIVGFVLGFVVAFVGGADPIGGFFWAFLLFPFTGVVGAIVGGILSLWRSNRSDRELGPAEEQPPV